jgi:hypothetical protein
MKMLGGGQDGQNAPAPQANGQAPAHQQEDTDSGIPF